MFANRTLPSLLLGALLAVTAAPALAIDEGASSLSLGIASGHQLDRTYTVLSGRYGYYFVRDFEAAIGLEAWRGNQPELWKVIPELRYVYSANERAMPYVGLFVSRSFYDGLPDRNTYGGRLGVYFGINRGSRLGVGAVYERIESCDSATYSNCSQTWPEVVLHFTF